MSPEGLQMLASLGWILGANRTYPKPAATSLSEPSQT
jgi:hypothetical protein